MKLSIGVLASSALADSYQKCFQHGNFLKQGFWSEGDPVIGKGGVQLTYYVPNGSITCGANKANECVLTCQDGYHYYGGEDIAKCRKVWKNGQIVYDWNINIAEVSVCKKLFLYNF